jgi:hypothetical protein
MDESIRFRNYSTDPPEMSNLSMADSTTTDISLKFSMITPPLSLFLRFYTVWTQCCLSPMRRWAADFPPTTAINDVAPTGICA